MTLTISVASFFLSWVVSTALQGTTIPVDFAAVFGAFVTLLPLPLAFVSIFVAFAVFVVVEAFAFEVVVTGGFKRSRNWIRTSGEQLAVDAQLALMASAGDAEDGDIPMDDMAAQSNFHAQSHERKRKGE